jgi:cobalt-zinc-cadmium efflux system outer membrane protein
MAKQLLIALIAMLLGTAALAQAPQPKITLAELEQIALANNPTLRQAQAEIRIAAGRKQQAGLYPNPMIGYTGEEIRGGAFGGGQHGFFVEQEIVLGGKLGAARAVFEQERSQAEIEAEEQRLRIMNGVRTLYYETLAAQRNTELHRELTTVAAEAARVTKQLANVGQSDETDVLQAEIEEQRAQMSQVTAQNNLHRSWRTLAAMIGKPEMPVTVVTGEMEAELPDIESEPWLEKLLKESPAVQIATAGVLRAQAQVTEARKTPIPNLQIRAGLQQNREFLEATPFRVGLQGFAEVGVQLPIFNRNQGSKAAARAEVERAQQEVQRVQLVLRERSAEIFEAYKSSRATADRYRFEVLPRAQKVLELHEAKYKEMVSSYPQVIVAKRTLLQLQMDYVATLENVWTAAIALRGYMLTDGLEAPARSGEMDQPVREINLPRARSRMER